MTTTTKTLETEKMIIKITLTREVNDKVSYADGYNITTGREVYENYDVKLIGKTSGKEINKSGKPGGFAFFEVENKFSGKYPAGAYARLGNAYVSKETYDVSAWP